MRFLPRYTTRLCPMPFYNTHLCSLYYDACLHVFMLFDPNVYAKPILLLLLSLNYYTYKLVADVIVLHNEIPLYVPFNAPSSC